MALDNLRNLPHEIMVDLDYLNAYKKKISYSDFMVQYLNED